MVKAQKSLVKGRKSKKRVRRKVMYLFKKPAAKEYEKIILVQEQIIKAREHTFKIYERVLKQISSKSIIKMEAMEQELQLAYKDRNEAIRRYNALHQLGEMAENMGVDLTEKLPEHEFNKWKNHEFDIKGRVLESGKTTFSASLKKKVSQEQQDFSRLHKKNKKKS
tara:strand:- start:535 stop:1032 length:498 start_codon:yes stop_codon:yes gene_type:complete